MTKEWTHYQCEACWFKNNIKPVNETHDAYRIPVRLKNPDLALCCFCNAPTIAGIFVREHPNETVCEGECITLEELSEEAAEKTEF